MTRERDDDELVRDSAPTLIREPAASTSVTAISMKTPGESGPLLVPSPPVLPKREVKLRAISEVGIPIAPAGGFGRLAPPHDPVRARAQQRTRAVVTVFAVIGIAAVVTVAVWWIAAWTG
jgi:hypothetical protein